MAGHSMPPYRAQDPGEVNAMVEGLERHEGKKSGKGGFSCRKNVYPVAGSEIKVASWKMQDWDYKKPNLPTYARGLFTYKNSRGEHEIAVRGYDKFFNHGEVRKTEWRNVEQNTQGPYELSVKENGCIIFMAGLEDGTLLVCSKHSTGDRSDVDLSHAAVGERWVQKHLATVGKTKQEFARALRAANVTAVAELCDDEFEEHVLAYEPDMAGLYLHGVNLNVPEFATYPAEHVDSFAERWGFKKTMHLVMDKIGKVKSFLDETAETGNYAGRATEGFVIRCKARENDKSPYMDWFFKYKFEEPYLMYRQWRECTKAMISGKEPKVKKNTKITTLYLRYAKDRLAKDPSLGKAYQLNHGIIKLRDDFLLAHGLTGVDVIRDADDEPKAAADTTNGDVVLVPVATIGCGKTTVALALVKLFGWGHVQNDNIQGKGRPPRFARQICDELKQYPVVVADRNNHLKGERKQLIDDVSKHDPLVKFVALNYRHKVGNDDEIRRKTRERVFSRGDNHQTIQADSKGRDFTLEIMEGFMNRFQPIQPDTEPDDGFDLVIDLDPIAESRDNLETVVSALEARYPALLGDKLPSADDMDEAIESAKDGYRPDIRHVVNANYRDQQARKENKRDQRINGHGSPNAANGSQRSPPKIEYFGVFVPFSQVLSALEENFSKANPEHAKFYKHLKQMHRVQDQFHVTLIHRSAERQNAEYWSKLTEMHLKTNPTKGQKQPVIGTVKVELNRVLWDDRLMAIKVNLAPMSDSEEHFFKSVNPVAHITVGTLNDSIKPKESNDMLTRWMNDQGEGVQELLVSPYAEGIGEVKAVPQRF